MTDRPRVVVVGGGFAGFHAARNLTKRLGATAEIVLVNSTDYFLYLPLLPEVAAGVLEPRRIAVPLAASLPGVRVVLGEVDDIDLAQKRVGWSDPEGGRDAITYDRLLLAVGSVNKLLPIPGVAEHAHGFRGLPEALYLRDHIVRQFELAADTDDADERAARLTFVVVGAGYTGTEVAAQGVLLTDNLRRAHAELRDQPVRWMLLDTAKRVLPELDERLSGTADRVLRERGVEVRMGASVEEAGHDGVRLTTGENVATRSLIWCVGVRADPLLESLGLKTEKGRVVVDEFMRVPGHPEVFASGDAAAVPDVTRPGQSTAMTAQHAERQGKLVARNAAASLGHGTARRYKHHDLGFVVELGGRDAAANPLHVPLAGLPAKAVTRGYHLTAMPGNRIRTLADWALDAVLPRQTVQLGLVRAVDVPLETATPEHPHHS
ncbi:MAG TPA: NAD(P)/FAD-dependent oxidoreductase [Pseudonocardia sp.]|nr:NAD(P)/FAD-dependent oxidoreductase [Pseudonocardia sp.]